jgi:hypothetical protein
LKRVLLIIFLIAALHAPWRLWALVAESFILQPGLTRTAQDDSKYWDVKALEFRLKGLGWHIEYAEALSYNGQEAYGVTIPADHKIFIESGLHWTPRYAVLMHEGGHTLQPWWLTTMAQSECFAESVAMLASHDGVREHARYLARYKLDLLLLTITEWPAIYRAAALLSE